MILKTGGNVQGLTTAACIWIVSAIGLAIGSGLYAAGIVTSVITVIALFVLRGVEKNMPKVLFRAVTISTNDSAREEDINAIFDKHRVSVLNTDYEVLSELKEMVFHVKISFSHELSVKKLVEELSSLQFIKKISTKS